MRDTTWKNNAGFLLTAVLLLVLSLGTAQAKPNPEKIANIKKLLLVSGIQEQLSYMKDGVMNSYSQMIGSAYPKVPDAFWTEFNALIGEKDMQALRDKVVPVYDKHMSNDVIKNLIAMFETPFWIEWRKKMPLISREAGVAGQKWIHELTQADAFKQKIDRLVEKHELEKLNSAKKKSK
ncbi:hypothetical protein MNBD_NITROSPINAE05-1047 [hydrothermal vent metagenome]|uniref:DUF2059 domain-containing protein n=1 Tax=hydrothermal vent metagenome TaxID=652676 RepID=A0A3B1D4H5_9ZZZZ